MRHAAWRRGFYTARRARRCTGQYVRRQPTATKLYQAGLQQCAAAGAAAALALQAGFTGVVGWNWLMGQPSLLAANATTTLNDG